MTGSSRSDPPGKCTFPGFFPLAMVQFFRGSQCTSVPVFALLQQCCNSLRSHCNFIAICCNNPYLLHLYCNPLQIHCNNAHRVRRYCDCVAIPLQRSISVATLLHFHCNSIAAKHNLLQFHCNRIAIPLQQSMIVAFYWNAIAFSSQRSIFVAILLQFYCNFIATNPEDGQIMAP